MDLLEMKYTITTWKKLLPWARVKQKLTKSLTPARKDKWSFKIPRVRTYQIWRTKCFSLLFQHKKIKLLFHFYWNLLNFLKYNFILPLSYVNNPKKNIA